jgi:acetyltransferase-like isoleucine patch superfamily enzyme
MLLKRLRKFIGKCLMKLLRPTVLEIIDSLTTEHKVDEKQQSSIRSVVQKSINNEIRVWGDPNRLKISQKTALVNTLFNTSSGNIEIGDYTFTGHNVSIITGTHDYKNKFEKRWEYPSEGRDIIIGKGVWIGSNATILGPCTIGDHAVIAAGAVVTPNMIIPPMSVVGGFPAKLIKIIGQE